MFLYSKDHFSIIWFNHRTNTYKYFLGGSSGIGRGAVLLLSKLGCSVAFGGRNKTELDNVAAKCKEARSDAQVINLFPPKRRQVIK